MTRPAAISLDATGDASGAVTCFATGSLRCRYRESFSEPKPLDPDRPTRIHIDLGHLAYTFAPGSRVALLVTSSCFPRIVPHPNTMAAPWATQVSVPSTMPKQ